MKPVSIAALLGGHDDDEDSDPQSSPDMGGDEDYEDLSPREIQEHKHEAAQAFLKAIKEDDSLQLLKAFEALHGLDHASWDAEGGDDDSDDDSEMDDE